MKRKIVCFALAAVLPLLSGCAGYHALYSQYLSSCSLPENQKTITVPQSNGTPITINQGCALSPPVDTSAKYWNAGATIGTALIGEVGGTIRSVHASKENRKIIDAVSSNAGARVGGDAVIGDSNSGNQTDATAPPFVIDTGASTTDTSGGTGGGTGGGGGG